VTSDCGLPQIAEAQLARRPDIFSSDSGA